MTTPSRLGSSPAAPAGEPAAAGPSPRRGAPVHAGDTVVPARAAGDTGARGRPGDTVAIQGERGSFSEQAALELLGDPAVAGFETFDEVAAAVAAGGARWGVLPAENSLVGHVLDVRELLARHGLAAAGEIAVPITQCLIARAPAPLEEVHEVRSHPVALRQCGAFLAAHPWMRAVPVADTAGAVREVCASGRPDLAAIAGRAAALAHGGFVLAEGIADRGDNVTRFVLVQRKEAAP